MTKKKGRGRGKPLPHVNEQISVGNQQQNGFVSRNAAPFRREACASDQQSNGCGQNYSASFSNSKPTGLNGKCDSDDYRGARGDVKFEESFPTLSIGESRIDKQIYPTENKRRFGRGKPLPHVNEQISVGNQRQNDSVSRNAAPFHREACASDQQSNGHGQNSASNGNGKCISDDYCGTRGVAELEESFPTVSIVESRIIDKEIYSTENERKFGKSGFSMKGESMEIFKSLDEKSSPICEANQKVSTSLKPFVSSNKPKVTVSFTKRPDFGKQGRPIDLVSNYFLLKGSGRNIYQYDIKIGQRSAFKRPEKTIKEYKGMNLSQLQIEEKMTIGKQKCHAVIQKLVQLEALEQYFPFYDGRNNLFTLRPLPKEIAPNTFNIEIVAEGTTRPKHFPVTIQPANKKGGNSISLNALNEVCNGNRSDIPHEAIMALEVILGYRDPRLYCVNIGRSFFSFSEFRKNRLDNQIEIWKGYNQSVHLTQRGPAVVVNVSTKAFHSAGFVIERACEILGFDITRRKLTPSNIITLKHNFSGIKVEVTHMAFPRKYTVDSVSSRSAKDLMIDFDGKPVSVALYFQMKYPNKKMQFPDLPCLSMKSSRKTGSYTPMEFCMIIPGQPKAGKLDGRQSAAMINNTAIPPDQRFGEIQRDVNEVAKVSRSHLTQLNMQLETDPVKLTARILNAPSLSYKNQSSARPDFRGVWRIDNKEFSQTRRNSKWILFSFSDPSICPRESLEQLSKNLVATSKSVGLNLSDPISIRLCYKEVKTYNALEYAKKCGVDFVFAIFTRNDNFHSYAEAKYFADFKLGIQTQCMEDTSVRKCDRPGNQVLNNIVTKLNTKLGGINHTLVQGRTSALNKTVIMGADAAHSPRGSACPSIAAVVGSTDDVPFQYAVSSRVQINKDESKKVQEIIIDMQQMAKHIFQSYKAKNSIAPEKIIFFRDGVSEGQFHTVLETELHLIQKACHEVFRTVLPITFIVVQKRHQTRFKPKHEADGVGGGKNVPPGTTVDTDVVHPVYFDFFLCSHEGIKGTSKPAHYVVLHDDNRFSADELQRICHDLCHVYARCNRSISIPAPVQYAHLAAARAKSYVDWYLHNKNGGSVCSGSSDDALPPDIIDSVNNMSMVKAPMFFV